MIKLTELQPDKALQDLLKDNIEVNVSDTESRIIEVYRQGERPNVDLGEEFIDVLRNGVIRSTTTPMGVCKGNLAVTIYCKAQSNGVSKFNRINSILDQLEVLIHRKLSGKFFFEINIDNVITPMIYNETTGYTTLSLNVEWYTTE